MPPLTSSSLDSLYDFTKQIFSLSSSKINDFQFYQAPFTSALTLYITIPIYFLMIYLIHRHVQQKKTPYRLTIISVIHNILFSIMSGWLLYESYFIITTMYQSSSALEMLCDARDKHGKGRAAFLYWIVYLTKFFELFDTVMLAFRGKPLTFLHLYHHSITIVLAYVQLHAEICIAWVPLVTNMVVHVVMYAYFALHALGIDVSFIRRRLTQLQIIQFIIDIILCIPPIAMRLAYDYPHTTIGSLMSTIAPASPCRGSWPAAWTGFAIMCSYLLLFSRLYFQNYKEKRKQHAL